MMWYVQDQQACFLTVFCTLWGTLWYLQWIWRKRHGEKFQGLVVLYPPSIKLRVTCVYVLLVVLVVIMCPSFQSGSLKTMLLTNGHWSILLARWRCLEWLIFNLVMWIMSQTIQQLQIIQNGIWFSLLGRKEDSSRMTWTIEKFMPSLPVYFGMVDIASYQGSWADLNLFLMFPCSCSWSH
jgi:hypothetical protein